MAQRDRRPPRRPTTAQAPKSPPAAPDGGFDRRRVFRHDAPGRRLEDRLRAAWTGGPSKPRTRVAVACGAALFRSVLTDFLAQASDLEICPWAGASDRRATRTMAPQVLIVDLALFLASTERNPAAARQCPALVLATPDQGEELLVALRQGAWGMVFDDAEPDQLLALIRAAAAGQPWEEQAYASAVLKALRGGRARRVEGRGGPALSRRERELVAEVADGASNAHIASTLGLKRQTVKNRLSAIFDKLGVSSRLELALYAWQHHLADRPEDSSPAERS